MILEDEKYMKEALFEAKRAGEEDEVPVDLDSDLGGLQHLEATERWMLGYFRLALCPGTWLLIGFQHPNWFSVLKSLPFTLGNEVSKLQRQRERRGPNAYS